MDPIVFRGEALNLKLPNGIAYILQLAGLLPTFSLPIVGIIGCLTASICINRKDKIGTFSRFTLFITIVSYLIYSFYYYQGSRFFLPAATLINLAAAVGCLDAWSILRQRILST